MDSHRTIGFSGSRRSKDYELAPVRDDTALAKLPAPERTAWQTMWSDVAALLQRAQKQ